MQTLFKMWVANKQNIFCGLILLEHLIRVDDTKLNLSIFFFKISKTIFFFNSQKEHNIEVKILVKSLYVYIFSLVGLHQWI